MDIEIDELNDYAVEPRYPADLPIHYPPREAQRAVELAKRVLDLVHEQLSAKTKGEI